MAFMENSRRPVRLFPDKWYFVQMNYTSYPQLYYHFIFIPMYTLVHASVHRTFSPPTTISQKHET